MNLKNSKLIDFQGTYFEKCTEEYWPVSSKIGAFNHDCKIVICFKFCNKKKSSKEIRITKKHYVTQTTLRIFNIEL